MNNKKIQAQMQINVSFLANTTQLLKQLQDSTKNLKLDSSLYKPITEGLTKGFKEAFDVLNQMTTGLNKKGLSPKQYDDFFKDINAKFQESIRFVDDLKKHLADAFNSPENKQGLKNLQQLRSELEKIKTISKNQKSATTRRGNAIKGLQEATGLDYELAGDTLTRIRDKLANNKTLRKDDIAWLAKSDLTDETKLKTAFSWLEKIERATANIAKYNREAGAINNTKTVEAAMKQAEKDIAKLEKNTISPELNKQNMAAAASFEALGAGVHHAADEFDPRWNQEVLPEATRQAKAAAMATSTLKEVFAQFGIHFTAAAVIKKFLDIIRDSFEFYKSLDSALNQIYVVSSLSINKVNELQQSFINMAKETGMALDDVTRAAVLFYQQGLNTDEVLEMTRVTAQFAKVAGIDATDAADKLTAAVNGYRLSAQDALSVADKFNKVAAASAADINELSTAFSKAAAQANQAGVSMDNYLAYIATMEEATREAPENLGTSLKTIFSRMQQIKTGENTEEGTDVNAVETALRSVNIALRDTNGQLRDLEEIFAELGPRWNTLDRNTQAYLGTIIAGTRQQSRFITLMQNWDRVLDLANQSANSAGQQSLMHAKAMDSIVSKLQQLNVAWQEFVSNIGNSSLFKGLISGLTSLLKLFNSGNKPIIALSMAVSLFSTKLKDLNGPLIKMLTNVKDKIKNGEGLSSILYGNAQKANAKDVEIEKNNQVLNQLRNRLDLVKEGNEIRDETNGKILTEEQLTEDIKLKEQEINKLIEERDRLLQKQQIQRGSTLSKIGTAVQTIGLMSGDTNTAGLLSATGGGIRAAGRFMTGDVIGGTVDAITSLITLGKTIADWSKNLEKKITDAVAKVTSSLENYNNLNTQYKSTETLIKRYKTLQNTIIKTESEQEEFNRVVQELSDTYDLEAVVDDFGNLSLNIGEVNEALDRLEEKRAKALKELNAQEIESLSESMSGLFNSNTIEDFYNELFTTDYSTYKNLLKGVEDGLEDSARAVSKNVAKTFSNNLKNAIMNEAKNNPTRYITTGVGSGLLADEEAFNSLSKSSWNEIYREIEYLKTAADSLTFNDVDKHLEQFYNGWSEKNKLTLEQWNVLKNSINNTVFNNASLIEFFEKVNNIQGKASGEYYEKEIKRLNDQIDEIEKRSHATLKYDVGIATGTAVGSAGGTAAGLWAGAKLGAAGGSLAGPVGTVVGAIIGAIGGAIGGAYLGGRLGGGEEYEKIRAAKEAIEELEEARSAYYEKFAEENWFIKDTEDAKKYINALVTLKNVLKDTTADNAAFWSNMNSAMDMEGLSGQASEQLQSILQAGIKMTEGASTEGDRYNIFAKYIRTQIEELDKTNPENAVLLKAKLNDILDEGFSNLGRTGNTTFTQLSEQLDTMSKKLRSMNSIVEEFKNNKGVISLESFADFASIIDSIDFSNLGKLENGQQLIDQTINALHDLNLAYDANNGMIKMNGKSLQSLQDIQEAQTKAQILNKINELKANKATIETEIALIQAQIDATEATLTELKTAGEGKVKYADLVSRMDDQVNQSAATSVAKITEGYKTDIANNNQWKTTIITNLADAADAWNAYYTAMRNGSANVDELYEKAQKTMSNYKWSAVDPNSGVDWKGHTNAQGYLVDLEGLRSQLTDYRDKLVNTKKQYSKSLELVQQEINLMTSLYNSDLSKLGTKASSKAAEIETYIGQLKEIYNILNRIDMLEHRLNTLDTYADVSKGKVYGDLLKERLGYNEELLNQYDFLVSEQKKFTNGYKDFIGTVEGLEGVFDFDQFGQIIINWEKYINLQDTAAKGQITLKEKADDVYETYQKMFDELKQDFDKYIAYLKNVINLLQEVIDAYKDMEDKAVNAIKEIYKKILDTRLEAIDAEKKAIDELQEARKRAREDQQNAKTMSGLQTNLQRAMMDTSGASDSNFIKAQKDIEDKLDQIADDKYSQMLQDIQQALDEEKDALQKDFDQLWENLDWLHSWLEENIMSDEEKLTQLFTQTEEWQTASNLHREGLMEEWDTKYQTYMSQLRGQDGKTIYDVWDQLGKTRQRIAELDTSLVQSDSKNSKEIIQTIKSWQDKTNAAISSAVTNAVNQVGSKLKSSSSSSSNQLKSNTGNYSDTNAQTCTISLNPGFDGGYVMKRTGVIGSVFTFPSPEYSRPGYEFESWGGYKAGATFKPTGKSYGFTAKWKKITTSSQPKFIGLTLNPNLYGNGIFASGGMATFTGPAWLDGTRNAPEAVLNPLQTEHFMHFTNVLDKMYSGVGQASNSSSVSIDNISFNVESMSSPEDGEKAFNMFVAKFREIGSQTGIKMNNFKNTV